MVPDPFLSSPPYPQNEHEARVVGFLFFVSWIIGLLFLYWEANRAIKDDRDEDSSRKMGRDLQ